MTARTVIAVQPNRRIAVFLTRASMGKSNYYDKMEWQDSIKVIITQKLHQIRNWEFHNMLYGMSTIEIIENLIIENLTENRVIRRFGWPPTICCVCNFKKRKYPLKSSISDTSTKQSLRLLSIQWNVILTRYRNAMYWVPRQERPRVGAKSVLTLRLYLMLVQSTVKFLLTNMVLKEAGKIILTIFVILVHMLTSIWKWYAIMQV